MAPNIIAWKIDSALRLSPIDGLPPRSGWVSIHPSAPRFPGLSSDQRLTPFDCFPLRSAVREFAHTRLRLISPAAFLATKYVAFSDRGNGDYYGSHDLEDFITVVDGRADIVAEIRAAPAGIRRYVVEAVGHLMAAPLFRARDKHFHALKGVAHCGRLPRTWTATFRVSSRNGPSSRTQIRPPPIPKRAEPFSTRRRYSGDF